MLPHTCPECGHEKSIPDGLPPRRARCPKCSAMVFFEPPEHTAAVADAIDQPKPRPRTRKSRGSMEGEMDLTPMVDVVFQLLIFFMVTASFKMQRSLEQPKPETDEASAASQPMESLQDNPEVVIVRVDATNTFHVTAAAFDDEIEAPSEQELLVKLRQAKQGDAQGNIPTKLLVLGDGDALHQRVVIALDAGTEVGMEEVLLKMVEGDDEE